MIAARDGTRHIQVRVRYRDTDIEVDAGIAGLLRALWDRGIATFGSCENLTRGMAVVWFDEGDDAAVAEFRRLTAGFWQVDFTSPTRPAVGFLSDDIERITEILTLDT